MCVHELKLGSRSVHHTINNLPKKEFVSQTRSKKRFKTIMHDNFAFQDAGRGLFNNLIS